MAGAKADCTDSHVGSPPVSLPFPAANWVSWFLRAASWGRCQGVQGTDFGCALRWKNRQTEGWHTSIGTLAQVRWHVRRRRSSAIY